MRVTMASRLSLALSGLGFWSFHGIQNLPLPLHRAGAEVLCVAEAAAPLLVEPGHLSEPSQAHLCLELPLRDQPIQRRPLLTHAASLAQP